MRAKYKQYGDLLTLGIMFPVCIAIGYGLGYLLDGWTGKQIGYGLGYLLDGWTGKQNIFSFIGILFGIAAAFINLFRVVRKLDGNP